MLRTYKPIEIHPIYRHQIHLQHLVCEVWCNSSNEQTCQSLLQEDFKSIYLAREWVKIDIDEIYELCKLLTENERATIREAFTVNNNIESLCEATIRPIKLDDLPEVVESKMKPLLAKFYKDLISAKEKLDYYNKLIALNKDYNFCPCCGLILIEHTESPYREDNDHYLPKAEYPFAAVNFCNLPPLCSKCNKKCKSIKNPFKNDRKSFYPFKPLDNEFKIKITIDGINTNYLDMKENEIAISFNNDPDKVDTWNWLFNIKSRYNEEIRQFSKTELRILANRFKRNRERSQGMSYQNILEDTLEDYNIDSYDDRKFLKIPFLKEILNNSELMNVYS